MWHGMGEASRSMSRLVAIKREKVTFGVTTRRGEGERSLLNGLQVVRSMFPLREGAWHKHAQRCSS